MRGKHEAAEGKDSMTGRMKTYRVSLHVEQTIVADDEEEALGIFWDDLMRNQAEEENATVESDA